ncbi:MAG: UDP-N-acetylmuramate dehydrogenase [Lachnospiraceae bacterium]|nr:UDP-N-acetylmuramate dehydrogenase [Lachnospiraceae bacterium]
MYDKGMLVSAFGDAVSFDEPLKDHTSFKTGGKADIFIKPRCEEEIISAYRFLNENNIPYFVMGNGTNLLFSDKGLRGAVLHIQRGIDSIVIKDDTVLAASGALLSALSVMVADASLSGFEFASGIPGTLGGAVYMNAGAYDGEIKDCFVSARVLDESGDVITLSKDDMCFDYRKSILSERNYIVLSVRLKLKPGNKEEIKEKIIDFGNRRRERQPLNFPSAGSTFKRPEGYFAGKLIEDAGLKGKAIGGAAVSEKHAGFIVNTGEATSEDILKLIKYCQDVVFEKFGVHLVPEVKVIDEYL